MYIRRFTWSKEDKSIEECFAVFGDFTLRMPVTVENQRELFSGDGVTGLAGNFSE